jgi:hypothetical protein
MFVFDAEARRPTLDSDPELETLVHDISVRTAESMQISVEELFRSAERAAAQPAAVPPVASNQVAEAPVGEDRNENHHERRI